MTTLLKIGHRGAAGYAPENTLRSFAKALELGVDMVELDVHRSLDGALVVIHDETLERTTNGTGEVAEKTLEELKTLDAGQGEKIPTLAEVLELVNRRAKVNIELKGQGTDIPVTALIAEYIAHRGWSYEDFLVSGYDHLVLWKMKAAQPQLRIAALVAVVPDGLPAFAREMEAYSVHIPLDGLSPQLVQDVHEREMKIFVYTVNEPDDIRRVAALGADGIFSDYPDRIG